jgi:hypothetical protein
MDVSKRGGMIADSPVASMTSLRRVQSRSIKGKLRRRRETFFTAVRRNEKRSRVS